jgi:hypothetical protein
MVIKMKDLIKDQTDMLREKFIHQRSSRLHEADPPPPAGGEGDDKPKKLKINIPDSPFEPDTNQVLAKLKQILSSWKGKEYPSDEIRWKSYYQDILKLINKIDSNNVGDDE